MEIITAFILSTTTLFYFLGNNEFLSHNFEVTGKIILILFSMFYLKKDKKKWKFFIISIFLFILTKTFYLSFLIILSLMINERIAKLYYVQILFYLFCCVVIMIVLLKYGIISENIYEYRIHGLEGVKIRHSLGFKSPNTIGLIFLLMRIAIYNLNFNKLKVFHFILLGFFSYLLYLLTYSRTSLLIFGFEIIIFYVFKLKYEKIKKMIVIMPILSYILFFLITVFYHNTILDKILSGRLGISYLYIKQLNVITFLFGDKEKFYLPLDNSYVYLLHDYGVIISLALIIILTINIKKILNYYDNKRIIYTYIIILIYSMSEAILFIPNICIIISIIISYSYKVNKK